MAFSIRMWKNICETLHNETAAPNEKLERRLLICTPAVLKCPIASLRGKKKISFLYDCGYYFDCFHLAPFSNETVL